MISHSSPAVIGIYLCNISKVHSFLCADAGKTLSKEEVESSVCKTVAFQEEKVTLDIPEAGIVLPSGWSIVPMAHSASVSLLYFLLVYTKECAVF